jgi:hypothetical protein
VNKLANLQDFHVEEWGCKLIGAHVFKDVKRSLNITLNWLFIEGGVYLHLNSISRRVVQQSGTLNWMRNRISCPLGDITCIIPLTEGWSSRCISKRHSISISYLLGDEILQFQASVAKD